jgi:hypothetical protein
LTVGTLKTLVDDIKTELDKPDLGDVVSSHLALAIRHYESAPFWFNEARTSIAAVSGTEYYSLPADFVAPLSLALTNGGNRFVLEQWNLARHEDAIGQISATGIPYAVSFIQNQIRSYPIPDSSYTYNLTYIRRLTALNSAGASNNWTTDGEELIKSRAQKTLSLGVLKQPDWAQAFSLLEDEAYSRLKSETLQRTTRGLTSRWGF